MAIYSGALDSVPSTDFTKPILCGTTQLNLHFIWDEANDEQYTLVQRALQDRAAADPLLHGIEIIKDYDWIDWYLNLPSDIEAALDEGMEYPQSVKNVANNIKANILLERKQEARDLQDLIAPLERQLAWNIEVTDDTNAVHVGVVRPGGWINNQGSWSLRFVSDLTNIGRNDLLKVVIKVEIQE